MRTFRYAALSVATVAALAACGSSSSSSSATSTPAAAASATTAAAAGGATTAAAGGATTAAGSAAADTITIKNFAFTAVKVAPGATVKIKNDDTARHTVTADDKSFDVAVGSGASGTITAPAKAGSYAYHCSVHSSMKGTLVVEG